jgi:flagellar biosynthesis regulator FlbT
VNQTRLEEIKKHVLMTRQAVARQRQLVVDQRAAGVDSHEAEKLLEQFERSLAILVESLPADDVARATLIQMARVWYDLAESQHTKTEEAEELLNKT